MNISDMLYMYREFERYDRNTRDYADTTPKMERFNDYINKLIRVCSVMQAILRANDSTIKDKDYEYFDLTDYEILNIDKAVNLFIRMEKRQAAASQERRKAHAGY